MLLRRVIEHVKAQNWTAVGLDFVIVVTGVFIGIQVANWNERGAQNRLGDEYRHRIVFDLQQDLANSLTQASYYSDVLESVLEAERLLAETNPDPRALVVAAYRASEIANNPANRATWDQVVSSGHLGLLSNSINSGLTDYYRYDQANIVTEQFLQDSPYRRLVRSIIPLSIQLEIRAGCSDTTDEVGIVTGFVQECELNIDSDALKKTASDLKSSSALKAELRNQYSLVFSVQNNQAGSINLLQRSLAALENEG